MSGYTETIRGWATDTRRAGLLPDADGTGEVGLDAQTPGARLAVRFTLKVEADRVSDIRYQVFGCGFSMAACAVAADQSVGKPLAAVAAIDAEKLAAVLVGLPAERSYCAELAVEGLQAAVRSARRDRQPVRASLPREPDHGARVTAADPVYAALLATLHPEQVSREDRHLFACLLAVAAREPYGTAAALGLDDDDLHTILDRYFPDAEPALSGQSRGQAPPQPSQAVLALLLTHLPDKTGLRNHRDAMWLARILATRAAHPGHLWVAMGLFERAELSAAIRRHLPSLAAANHQNMRWKRYLYKQVCERNGGTLCKAPSCGACSDYALCFAEDL